MRTYRYTGAGTVSYEGRLGTVEPGHERALDETWPDNAALIAYFERDTSPWERVSDTELRDRARAERDTDNDEPAASAAPTARAARPKAPATPEPVTEAATDAHDTPPAEEPHEED